MFQKRSKISRSFWIKHYLCVLTGSVLWKTVICLGSEGAVVFLLTICRKGYPPLSRTWRTGTESAMQWPMSGELWWWHGARPGGWKGEYIELPYLTGKNTFTVYLHILQLTHNPFLRTLRQRLLTPVVRAYGKTVLKGVCGETWQSSLTAPRLRYQTKTVDFQVPNPRGLSLL